MFEVVAYPQGETPFVVIKADDRAAAMRVYAAAAEGFDRQGLPTTVGVDRRDATAPQGWREIASNRKGAERPVFPRN
jgi:hypothetical protein